MESLTGAMPYCQIAKSRISAQTCAETQGQDGCFGCAAETRKCEYCKEKIEKGKEIFRHTKDPVFV